MMSSQALPPYDRDFANQTLRAAGHKPLNPIWAKLEILIGLAVATLGLILLRDRVTHDALCAATIVLGLYLAAAGHRSHLYQSQNHQTAYLLQVLQTSGQNRSV
jgi:hypothetical protein